MYSPVGDGLVVLLALALVYLGLPLIILIGAAFKFLTSRDPSVAKYKLPLVLAVVGWYGFWLFLIRMHDSYQTFLVDATVFAPFYALASGFFLCLLLGLVPDEFR